MSKIIKISNCYDCLKMVRESELRPVHDKHGERFVCKKCKDLDNKLQEAGINSDIEDYRF